MPTWPHQLATGLRTRTTQRTPPGAVLAVLVATGWAANHFAALIPVLHQERGFSSTLLAAVFGVYAVGLLPGLVVGGVLSDRIGRAWLALPGAAVAAAGSLTLLAWHPAAGLATGRLIVGLGAGATFSACTAWMADLAGAHGTTLAGIALTAGFGGGPVASGLLAAGLPAPLALPFIVSAVLSLGAVLACIVLRQSRSLPADPSAAGQQPVPAVAPEVPPDASAGTALSWAVPIAPFVFTAGAVGVFTVPTRLPARLDGPLLAGMSAGVVLGAGLLAQFAARRRGRPFGVTGLLCCAAGLSALAAVGSRGPVIVVTVVAVLLGAGYGLCLHAGLVDLDRWSPVGRRGALTGVFYVATYLGFGVPLLLEALAPRWGTRAPLTVLAATAVVIAVLRALRRS